MRDENQLRILYGKYVLKAAEAYATALKKQKETGNDPDYLLHYGIVKGIALALGEDDVFAPNDAITKKRQELGIPNDPYDIFAN